MRTIAWLRTAAIVFHPGLADTVAGVCAQHTVSASTISDGFDAITWGPGR